MIKNGIIFDPNNKYIKTDEDVNAFFKLFDVESILHFCSGGIVNNSVVEELFDCWSNSGYFNFYTLPDYSVLDNNLFSDKCIMISPKQALNLFSIIKISDAMK